VKSPVLKIIALFGNTLWIELNFYIESTIAWITVYPYFYCVQLTIAQVYFDKKAFKELTIDTLIVPLVYNLTWSEAANNGLVPKGIYLIFHGFNLSLDWMVAKVFKAITSDDFLN
jgi:uncharacterized membrane protein YccF (DUF307 family)